MKKREFPLMMSYKALKVKHPDIILFINTGYFCVAVADDAIAVSKILNVTIIQRRVNGQSDFYYYVQIPKNLFDRYLPKLEQAGKSFLFCDLIDESSNVDDNNGTEDHGLSIMRHRDTNNSGPQSEVIVLNTKDIESNIAIFISRYEVNHWNKSIYFDDLLDVYNDAKENGYSRFEFLDYKYNDIIKHSKLAIKCANAHMENKDVNQILKEYTSYDENMNIFSFNEDFKLDWVFDPTIDAYNDDINKDFVSIRVSDIRKNASIMIVYKNRHIELESQLRKYLFELIEKVQHSEKNNSPDFVFDKSKYAELISDGLHLLAKEAHKAYEINDLDSSLSFLLAYEDVIDHVYALGYNYKDINNINHLFLLYLIYLIDNDIDNVSSIIEKVISREKSFRYYDPLESTNSILNSWNLLNPDQFTITNINGRQIFSSSFTKINVVKNSIENEILYLIFNKNKENIRKLNKLSEKLYKLNNPGVVIIVFEKQIELGLYEDAITSIEKLLGIGYRNRHIYETLIYLYFKMSNFEALKSTLQEAIEILTDDFEYRKSQVFCLAKKFNREDIIIERMKQGKIITFWICTGIEENCGFISLPAYKYLDDWRKKLKGLIEKNKITFPCPYWMKRLKID